MFRKHSLAADHMILAMAAFKKGKSAKGSRHLRKALASKDFNKTLASISRSNDLAFKRVHSDLIEEEDTELDIDLGLEESEGVDEEEYEMATPDEELDFEEDYESDEDDDELLETEARLKRIRANIRGVRKSRKRK